MLTNSVPTCPIRGCRRTGRPVPPPPPERLMDEAARQLRIDRFELRRRNLIRPDQLPYKTISHLEYDCGDFTANFDRALELSDRPGFEERVAASARAGKLRGFGLCNTVEALGFGLNEEADIRCAVDGTVELRIGSMSNGQGHDTIYAQIVAGKLGLPVSSVKVIQGDTDDIAYGTGTGACRSDYRRRLRCGLHVGTYYRGRAGDCCRSDGGCHGRCGIPGWPLCGQGHGPDDCLLARSAKGRRSRRPRPLHATRFHLSNGAHCCEVVLDPETGAATVDATSWSMTAARP